MGKKMDYLKNGMKMVKESKELCYNKKGDIINCDDGY